MICSTALRAQQTLDPIIKGAKMPPKVVLKRELYGRTQQLWEQLWNLPESAKSVLLIGHNPALHNLALELVRTDKPTPAFERFPTGAIASFHLDGAWKALEAHGAVLTSLVTPKSIAGVNVHTCERNS
jgi:phosphohistidine phosphatase